MLYRPPARRFSPASGGILAPRPLPGSHRSGRSRRFPEPARPAAYRRSAALRGLAAVRRFAACLALGAALLFASATAAQAGPSNEGQSGPAGPGLLNLSNNGDSLLEVDRTLNFNFGGQGGNAGSDNDN